MEKLKDLDIDILISNAAISGVHSMVAVSHNYPTFWSPAPPL